MWCRVTGKGYMDVNRISGYIPGKMVFFLMQVALGCSLCAVLPSVSLLLLSGTTLPEGMLRVLHSLFFDDPPPFLAALVPS